MSYTDELKMPGNDFSTMFLVVITRAPKGLIKQLFFNNLREARQCFNRIVREKTFGQGLVRLIEKRDYCHSFLLDTCMV